MVLSCSAHARFLRHGESAYNKIQVNRRLDPLYLDFLKEYSRDATSSRCKSLARGVKARWSLNCSDFDTPLEPGATLVAELVGRNLRAGRIVPDAVFVSPYLRTHQTLQGLIAGWPELARVETIEDERIREQEHGLLLNYGASKVMFTLHPEQKELFDAFGPNGRYYYTWPQGESVLMVRTRIREFQAMLERDWAGAVVLMVTHHLTILAFRADLENLDANEFLRLDREDRPINCGITTYQGVAGAGRRGRDALQLVSYNQKLY